MIRNTFTLASKFDLIYEIKSWLSARRNSWAMKKKSSKALAHAVQYISSLQAKLCLMKYIVYQNKRNHWIYMTFHCSNKSVFRQPYMYVCVKLVSAMVI